MPVRPFVLGLRRIAFPPERTTGRINVLRRTRTNFRDAGVHVARNSAPRIDSKVEIPENVGSPTRFFRELQTICLSPWAPSGLWAFGPPLGGLWPPPPCTPKWKMDPYQTPDQQSDATIQAMVTRLEQRGQHPFFLQLIANYANQVRTDIPLHFLDLGCGTGVAIRQFEKRLHPESTLIGADISGRLLDAARMHSPSSRIHWHKLESAPLPYDASRFDVIVMHTVLSHVREPAALLREAHRTLKPGGALIVFDADHASTTYGLPDYAKTRATDQKLVSAIATHPDICRQLPGLLKHTGFELQRHSAAILSECGRGDFWLSSVKSFAHLIPALGILSDEEGRAWVESMLSSHEGGTFFAAGCYYTFFASKP